MKVLMFSPGFPAEMPRFTRGLAQAGAQVLGLGDQPEAMLPQEAKDHLSAYLRVPNLWDEDAVIRAVSDWIRPMGELDRVECLWEPGMMLAARLRQALGVPGMTPDQTVLFRDKEAMKQALDAAGIRTPRHASARTAGEMRFAAERIGYPLIIKPIAGAGSADTYRVEDATELERVLRLVRHVPEVSVEEFIDAHEFTFDTICSGGEILFENIAWYRPNVLVARSLEWVSPQTVNLRDLSTPQLEAGRQLGRKALKALGFETGFTHMEWFLKEDGEAVFGEIGARPPGARSVDIMNYTCDTDVYVGWAEAACFGRFSQPTHRLYNAAVIFKRAQGEGRIQRVEGLEHLLAHFGEHVVCVDLLPQGHPRRNWKQTLLSDGYLIVRHPDLQATTEMADRVGSELQMYAG
ncbi:MAG: ATP-grasp domain-containing protein [Deltaproteobacteria bacterium]|nr:ATP-grasp domain-containing protein [Deltaproteobacteria bacterium]